MPNWKCPLDDRVWSSPIAALSHVYLSSGPSHGREESLIIDDEIPWPEPTDEDPTEETVLDGIEPHLSVSFPHDIEEMVERLADEGFEVPPALSEEDLETFRVLERNLGIQNDLEKIEQNLEYYDRIFSAILENWDDLVGESPEPLPEPEPDPEPEETEDVSGRFTTADVREREEDEVFAVLNRSTLLDEYTDDLFETFKFVYEKRDTDGVSIDEVEQALPLPFDLAEENLEQLVDLNLARFDDDSDLYYVPY